MMLDPLWIQCILVAHLVVVGLYLTCKVYSLSVELDKRGKEIKKLKGRVKKLLGGKK